MPPHRSTSPDASARTSDVAEPGDATPPPPAHASSGDDDNGDCAAAVVETLKALGRDSREARMRMRYARAIELEERAVTTAVAMLPSSASLILAFLHRCVVSTRSMAAGCASGATLGSAQFYAAASAAWAGGDAQLLVHSQRCAELLHARSRAGTLWTPTREEQLYFGMWEAWNVADALFDAVCDALTLWPPPSTPASQRLLARDCGAAIRAVLQLDAAGQLIPEQLLAGSIVLDHLSVHPHEVGECIASVLDLLLSGSTRVPISLLRSECRLTPEEEEAMKRLSAQLAVCGALAKRSTLSMEQFEQLLQQRANNDLARHGLRACALPGCTAMEPHQRLSRCAPAAAAARTAAWSISAPIGGATSAKTAASRRSELQLRYSATRLDDCRQLTSVEGLASKRASLPAPRRTDERQLLRGAVLSPVALSTRPPHRFAKHALRVLHRLAPPAPTASLRRSRRRA